MTAEREFIDVRRIKTETCQVAACGIAMNVDVSSSDGRQLLM